MSVLAYIQIDAVPFFALLFILISSKSKSVSLSHLRRFHLMLISVMGILFLDAVNWYLLISPGRYPEGWLWLTNIIYYLLTELIAFFWFLYIYHLIHNSPLTRKQEKFLRLCLIPLIIICAVIIFSPWTHMIFYIDSVNLTFHRGNFHILQVAFGFAFISAASVLALKQSKKSLLSEGQKELRFLSFVAILPSIGGLLQLINYNFIFLWPFTAAALFLIYAAHQRHHISVDSLTSLNNRGSLERHLISKIHSQHTGWYFIIMDADDFKSINDQYGHLEGDHALQLIAEALKHTFGPTAAFISRYGGDEFAIISEFESEDVLKNTLLLCQNSLTAAVNRLQLPYPLNISVGYSRFENTETTPLNTLIQQADKNMYKQKQQHKRERH